MPIICGYNFLPFSKSRARGYYVHLLGTVLNRRTLSFGFYRRNPSIAKTINTYGLKTSFTPKVWADGWYFGVNFRVKCQQGATLVPTNIAYADMVAPSFLRDGWILIPHYYNAPNDQGVDFFKLIPADLLYEYRPKLDKDGNPTVDWNQLPQPIKDWVKKTIDEAKGIIDSLH